MCKQIGIIKDINIMACVPKTLAEHLSKQGDLFRYDELVGSVI